MLIHYYLLLQLLQCNRTKKGHRYKILREFFKLANEMENKNNVLTTFDIHNNWRFSRSLVWVASVREVARIA